MPEYRHGLNAEKATRDRFRKVSSGIDHLNLKLNALREVPRNNDPSHGPRPRAHLGTVAEGRLALCEQSPVASCGFAQ